MNPAKAAPSAPVKKPMTSRIPVMPMSIMGKVVIQEER